MGILQRKKLFPLLDIAYQGFASGDPNKDAAAVRLFAESGVEMMVAQSFAKNFGLYSPTLCPPSDQDEARLALSDERVGNLVLIVGDAKVVDPIKSRLSLIIRANYSNPPNHGAKVVHMILTEPAMRKQWFESNSLHQRMDGRERGGIFFREESIQSMSSRIKEMRSALRKKLEELGTPGDWSHITTQIGMFSFTGLNRESSFL